MTAAETLPDGPLVAWYGDDFTGSSAVLETLTFAGLPAVLFFDIPTTDQLARFPGVRGIGVASVSRSKSPAWMSEHLPTAFGALSRLSNGIVHYKVCTTLDSSPETGSIGKAIEIGAEILESKCIPILIAAPQMRRYQCYGQLFAAMGDDVFRIDRHPVMSRHPVTPISEADVARHIQMQSDRVSLDCINLESLGDPELSLVDYSVSSDSRIVGVTIDSTDEASETAAGALIWKARDNSRFVVGSQGIEFALIRHFQNLGLLEANPQRQGIGRVERMAIVSGSVSPVTAQQIGWSRKNGVVAIQFDVCAACGSEQILENEIERVVGESIEALSRGADPLVYTAEGPDDPAVGKLQNALIATETAVHEANRKIGDALGQVLLRLVETAGLERAVISGGDTSGYATQKLDLYALTALAPTIPGAAIFTAHANGKLDGLQLALKGGQMGSTDYFGWIKNGGGPR